MANRLVIGYQNRAEDAATATADNVHADYPVANLFDWKLYDFYRMNTTGTANIVFTFSTAVTVDYFAMYKTNLRATGGTYKLQYWTGSAWADCFAASTVPSDAPLFKLFTARTATQFRLVVTSNPVAFIGAIAFGQALIPQYGVRTGFAPPRFARSTEVYGTMSDSGIPLGRTVMSKGFRTSVPLEFISGTDARLYMDAFLKHAEIKPFFMAWDYDNYPLEVAFAELDGETPSMAYTHHDRMALTLPVRGLME